MTFTVPSRTDIGAHEDVPFLDLSGATRDVADDVLGTWRSILDSQRFIGGEIVESFETRWAAYCQASHAIGMANGTDALHLVLRALEIGEGDEVIVPANSFVATAEAVVLAGATPRFADVDPHTLLLTEEGAEAVRTSRTRAIIPVHLYGQMADVDALGAYAKEQGIFLIEDAAQAQGATWRGRRAGSAGIAGCFSFYPGKNLGAFGDAGAVVTSDPDLAMSLRSLRDHGRLPGSHYDHGLIGTNSRLDSVQAAVLSAKLGILDGWNQKRRNTMARYREALANGPLSMVAEFPESRGVVHLAVVRVPDRSAAQELLAGLGVKTAIHYPIPLHQLAPYAKFSDQRLPVAEQAAEEVLSLPMFPHMSERQIATVCAALKVLNDMCRADGAAGV